MDRVGLLCFVFLGGKDNGFQKGIKVSRIRLFCVLSRMMRWALGGNLCFAVLDDTR